MKYYSIEPSLNTKVLGNYPQVKNIKYNCHVWDEPKFIEHVHFEKVDFEPIIANAILYAKSKLTDLISVTGMGFTLKLLISSKLKNILENKRKTGLQFFRSPIIQNDHLINNYWILNYYEISYQFLDFKNSVFFETTKFDKTNKLEINNQNAFIQKQNEIAEEGYPKGLLIDKIAIKKDNNEHFFLLQNTDNGTQYIVSEKLKKEIEEANCTGIEFQPIELSLTEWLHGGEREKIYGKT
ncbi:imm11 family protein [Flavobacterium sp. WG21]|uniref:imm11 family protein n=1 Tax=Flavobacterium sp. WG21 TaxID=1229487 RepID=UPI0003492E46|nr:DUF1629 domain-containing protein [Flavobacterium sp. WG21]